VEIFLGEIPIAEYATPGTQAFADSIKPYLQDFNLFLLANHGALAIGADLEQAYYRMEIVDQYCRILLYTRQLGDFRQITQEKMQDLFKLKDRFGIPDRRLQPGGSMDCRLPSPVSVSSAPPPADCMDSGGSQDDLTAQVRRIVRQVLQDKGQVY